MGVIDRYRSAVHAIACRRLGTRHLRTRPYCPPAEVRKRARPGEQSRGVERVVGVPGGSTVLGVTSFPESGDRPEANDRPTAAKPDEPLDTTAQDSAEGARARTRSARGRQARAPPGHGSRYEGGAARRSSVAPCAWSPPAGSSGIAVVLGAVLVGQDVASWIVGLAVGLISVTLAALLWSARQL
jgi:hypothetical protein